MLLLVSLLAYQGTAAWQRSAAIRQAQLAAHRIQQILNYARTLAISSQAEVRVACAPTSLLNDNSLDLRDEPPATLIQHASDWNQTVVLYHPTGAHANMTQLSIIKRFERLATGGKTAGTVHWQGSLANQEISFKSDGSSSCQGHFSYLETGETPSSSLAGVASQLTSVTSTSKSLIERWRITLLMSGLNYFTPTPNL